VSGLGDRLRDLPVPEEEAARERAQAVSRAAFAARTPVPRESRLRRASPALAVATVMLALVAFTPPGQALSNWVRDTIGRSHVRHTPRPVLSRLPAPGSLLVQSPEGPWVVHADGSKRLLGPYSEATWSPQGRFVAATRPQGLLAVEPGGRVRWTLARPGASRPRWAPSGFRVAYLTGATVRVVAGDGTGDERLTRGLPGVAAEWQPGAPQLGVVAGQKTLVGANVLAVARPGGGVRAIDVDRRFVLWSSPQGGPRVRQLSWSGDGRQLLAMAAQNLSVLDVAGRVLRRVAGPAGSTFVSAAFAPRGRRIAFVRRHRGVSQLMLAGGAGAARPRLLFAGAGRLGGVTWSPDGRWLLVGWPTSDQFLFVRTAGPARVQAVPGVAREFDPRAAGAAGAPQPAGWR
jgi:hypothetical protein